MFRNLFSSKDAPPVKTVDEQLTAANAELDGLRAKRQQTVIRIATGGLNHPDLPKLQKTLTEIDSRMDVLQVVVDGLTEQRHAAAEAEFLQRWNRHQERVKAAQEASKEITAQIRELEAQIEALKHQRQPHSNVLEDANYIKNELQREAREKGYILY